MTIEERVEVLEEEMDTVQETIAALQATVTELATDLSAKADMTSVSDAVLALEVEIQTMTTSFTAIQVQFNKMIQMLQTQGGAITDLQRRVTALEGA